MANLKTLTPFIFSWEGKFVDHPNDRGGATNKGITYNTLKEWRASKGLPEPTIEDLKNLSTAEAEEIYRVMYWNDIKGDEIENQAIANLLCDWRVTSGVWAIKHTQRALGLVDDGIVGNITISTLNNTDAHRVFLALWSKRKWMFEALAKDPSQVVFLTGWLRRLDAIGFKSLTCEDGLVITW